MTMKTKSKACPNDDVFLRVFLKGSDENEQETFIDHVFFCSRCRIKFDVLRSLGQDLKITMDDFPKVAFNPQEAKAFRKLARARIREIESAGRKAPLKAFLRKPNRLVWAAPALLAVILAAYFLVLKLPKSSSLRTPGESGIQLIAPRGSLAEAPSVFSWKPYDNADSYYYKLVDEDLNTVFAGNTNGNMFVIDEDLRRKLVKGRTYLWSVEARTDATALISMAKETFIIR
jgi:hypothetical protein